jgi:integrase
MQKPAISDEVKRRRPKSANGNGGARKRQDGTWEWRMSLPDGRRVSGYGTNQAEARQRCLAKVTLADQGVDYRAARKKVGDFLAWWLADVAATRCSAKTLRTYTDLVRLHIAPDLGRIELGKLSAQQVQSLLRKKEREGLSPRTVGHIRGVVRTALNDGVRLGVVARNVALLTDPPRHRAPEREPFTAEEARVLLAAAHDDRLAALYRLALSLGLRRGELLGLRWQDVDLDSGTLRVARSLQRVNGTITLKEPKTERSRRTLSLPPSSVTALRAHHDRQAWERKAAGGRWRESGMVFTTSIGTSIDPDRLTKEYKALQGRAGLRNQRFHDLRHTAATLMLRDGLPVHEVSAVLGHAQTSTTLNVYSHVLPGANERVATAMERLLG